VKKPPNRPNKQEGSDDMKDNNSSKIQKIDKKNIEELLRSVMQQHLTQQSSIKIEKTKNIHNLVNLVSEYLSPFIILGYDIDGQPVNLIHSKSQMDADALSAAINRLIFSNNKHEE
jgi:hypothetical protein